MTNGLNKGRITCRVRYKITKKPGKGKAMNDPLVTGNKVPAYEIVEEKIKEIDNTIIIFRTFYIFDSLSYRFQLIKKNKMCMVEIPRRLLEAVKNDSTESEQELTNILKLYIQKSQCWAGFEE